MEDKQSERFPMLEQFRRSRRNKQEENPASPGSQVLTSTAPAHGRFATEDAENGTEEGQLRRGKQENHMSYREYQQSISGVLGIASSTKAGNPPSHIDLARAQSPPQVAVPQTALSQPSSSQDLFLFKKNLLSVLSKFGGQHTQQQAAEELKRLMKVEITDNDRMLMFLTCLANIDEHMNISQMKEQMKQFGVAAEIFEDALVPFVPKMLNSFQKRIKEEGSNRLHLAMAETLGQMVWNIVDKIPEYEQQIDIFMSQFLEMPFRIIPKTTNKVVQSGAIVCLTKILINCPDDVLYEKLEEISDKLLQIFKSKTFQAHQ